MAVRRAAGARWAARRREAAEREAAPGDPETVKRADSEPLSHPAAKSSREPRQRHRTAPATEFAWDPSAFGMFPPPVTPYGMYPNPYMAGMYPPWMPMSPMYTGVGMPAMYPGTPMSPQMDSPSQRLPPNVFRMGGKAANSNSRGKSRETTRRRGRRNGTQRSDTLAVSAEDPMTPGPVATEDSSPGCGEALSEVRRHGTQCELTLDQVLPEVSRFARDRDGSQFLQSRLNEATEEDRRAVFEALQHEAAALSSNAFGSVVVQKLFELGTPTQRKALAEELRTQLLKYANDAYGCRVLQAAIQHVPRESQHVLAAELEKDVAGCIQSMHGNHVIQKCIEQMSPDSLGFIVRVVEERTEEVASHKYGCRVVQRLLEYCRLEQLEKILDQIISNTPKLAQDFYGNYVVQHMLQHGRKEDKKRIIRTVQSDVLGYAKHRFASNVVEKCIEVATSGEHAHALEEERAALVRAMLGDPSVERSPIHHMMNDRFGAHVVQCAVEHSRGPERELFLRQLETAGGPGTPAGGRRVLAALQKEFGQPQNSAD
mmetsp:Transcript_118071/g.329119  ORF Transcript_118071/g.329119 Transcript_118071/m.329119 type:complete len:543 (-) Transcript_118071:119-1747(-)|eukprot:CAMPEP_0179042290 /NCGR_PEP_ID=MMETSP0796-20121207/16589_1 /TAXON_ID=73915 /ORGANISM="Pyrodinium bahamense, Strain pbaha01" /LENGTH=542 /DNA_ID=CAMNT_0020738667 /DNA_START=46 /DNA_END=1674 /DNA_ORIENTATION=-